MSVIAIQQNAFVRDFLLLNAFWVTRNFTSELKVKNFPFPKKTFHFEAHFREIFFRQIHFLGLFTSLMIYRGKEIS